MECSTTGALAQQEAACLLTQLRGIEGGMNLHLVRALSGLSPRGAIWLHLWHANEHKYLYTVKCLGGLQTIARSSYTKMLVPQQGLKKQKIKTLKDAFRVFQIRRECQKPKTHGIFTIQPSFHRWQQWSTCQPFCNCGQISSLAWIVALTTTQNGAATKAQKGE